MNTCIHSASHGTVNSVNTRSAYLPLCISHPHPSAALAPSRLAARRPRSRRPGRARRPSRRSCPSRCPTAAFSTTGFASLLLLFRQQLSPQRLQLRRSAGALAENVLHNARIAATESAAAVFAYDELGVWLISWPTTVTVAQILPVRNGIITGAARFLDAPTDLKGVSSPVVRAAAAAGAASGAAVGACIVA